MVEYIKLSIRLQRVAEYLPKGAYFADIGSDHAYLPCYVCLRDDTARAIAGEVNEGPCNSAKETVTTNKLSHVVDVRLGDGLQVIKDEEIKQLVIAGMGGTLIRTILVNGNDRLSGIERIIAQPNVDAKSVRKWMNENEYAIRAEEVVEENGHFYEIIVGDASGRGTIKALTAKEILFGPLLLMNKTPAFYNKWEYELAKLRYVLRQMKQAATPDLDKINQFQIELEWIKEELKDGKLNL